MFRSRISYVTAVLAILAVAMPLAARSNAPKNSKATATASVNLLSDATIGGKQVKAGTYEAKANESTLILSRDGRVVAEAPIEWKDESSKQKYSAIVTDSGTVKEVHFSGKSRYAQVSTDSMATTGQH
jgi:hypothetical protein